MSAPADINQGAILALAIAQAAGWAGVPISVYARPLSPSPRQWLVQLSRASAPKPATVARIRALIAGETPPPPPPNNFQKSPRQAPLIARRIDPVPSVAPVDRDPCFLCGVRGDIGCNCWRRG